MNSLLTLPSDDVGKLVLRVTVGGIMLFHGVWKLAHGIGWLIPILQMHGLPGFLAYGVFISEVLAPLLLFSGWLTRLASLTIVIDMLVAILLVLHRDILAVKPGGGGWGIELEAFFLFSALALTFTGGGKFGVTGGKGKWD
jgi:putative oxidoreductase